MAIFRLNQAASEILLELAPNKIVPFSFVLSLTRAQLNLFIDTSLASDGHVSADGATSISQADPARLEAFDLACLLVGRCPHRMTEFRDGHAWMWRTSIT